MFALDCWHGLTFDDRRFYYDPIYSILSQFIMMACQEFFQRLVIM